MKQCYNCKQEKSLTEFRQYKSGENKGRYHSYCRKCQKYLYIRYRELNPWVNTFNRILNRCNYKHHHYHKYGIKNFLQVKDLKYLWFRDKAYLMNKPSIDRINSYGDYTLDNCRYLELKKNVRGKRRNIPLLVSAT